MYGYNPQPMWFMGPPPPIGPGNPRKISKKSLKTAIKDATEAIRALPELVKVLEEAKKSEKKSEEKKGAWAKLDPLERALILMFMFPVVGICQIMLYLWAFSSISAQLQAIVK